MRFIIWTTEGLSEFEKYRQEWDRIGTKRTHTVAWAGESNASARLKRGGRKPGYSPRKLRQKRAFA